MNLFRDQAFVWSKWEVLFLHRVKSSFFSGLSNELNSYYRGIQYTQIKLDVRLVFCVHVHQPRMVNEPQNTHPRRRPRGSQLQGPNWKRREESFQAFSPVLEEFRRAFFPDPTDSPWVDSKDAKYFVWPSSYRMRNVVFFSGSYSDLSDSDCPLLLQCSWSDPEKHRFELRCTNDGVIKVNAPENLWIILAKVDLILTQASQAYVTRVKFVRLMNGVTGVTQ